MTVVFFCLFLTDYWIESIDRAIYRPYFLHITTQVSTHSAACSIHRRMYVFHSCFSLLSAFFFYVTCYVSEKNMA